MAMDITQFAAPSLLAVGIVVYQHFHWKALFKQQRDDFENRISAASLSEYLRGRAEGELLGSQYKSFKFIRHESRRTGIFSSTNDTFTLEVLVVGRGHIKVAGDTANIEKFQVPPEVKQLIKGVGATGFEIIKVIGAINGVPVGGPH